MTYQSRIAAWFYVRMLGGVLGHDVGEAPNLGIQAVRCESDQPIDDVLVEFSDRSRVLIQAKHGLTSISAGKQSAFSAVIRQFVQQTVLRQATQPSAVETMLLVVDPTASGSIKSDLRSLFDRFALAPEGGLDAVPANAREHEVRRILDEVISREWQEVAGKAPATSDVEDVLRRSRVRVLDVDPGGSDERTARDLLQSTVLTDISAIEAAWAFTVEYASQAIKARGLVDRVTLQHYLSGKGVALRPALDDRTDIEKLVAVSKRTLESLARYRTVSFDGVDVHVQREVLGKLRDAIKEGDLVVVGEPGCGKSALLHELATTMSSEHDVVVLAADTFDDTGVAANAGLARELDSVLRHWPGLRTGILIVDALDAARSERAAAQMREMITRVLSKAPRWRVVASIRKYDLRYGTQLARLFAGTPPTDAADAQFANIRHVSVGQLTEGEVSQLVAHVPDLKDALARAPARLTRLLGNIFNVRLFAEILASGVAFDSLHSVRTQADLLDRYWAARVLSGSGAERDARELVLTRAVENMVSTRALRANRREIADTGGALDALLSANVLVEWQAADDARPVRALIAFAHHIVFDYAVECLYLRPDPGPLKLVEDDPSLVVAIRPSLVLHLQYLWGESPRHSRFWSLALEMARSPKVPEIAKIVGPLVASDNVAALDDFETLLAALADPVRAEFAERVLQHVVGAAIAGSKIASRPLAGDGAGPWCELSAAITHRRTNSIAWTITMLLRGVFSGPMVLTLGQAESAGRAARWLFDYVIALTPYNAFWVRDPIRFVARTFASSPSESAARLRVPLNTARSHVQLQAELAALASEAQHFIEVDSLLGRDVYTFIFTLGKRSGESVALGPGRILGLSTTVDQQLDHARYVLAELFPAFLDAAPGLAAEALGCAVEDYVQRRRSSESAQRLEERFTFRGAETSIVSDFSEIWDSSDTYAGDYPLEMLDDFEKALAGAASDSGLASGWADAVARLLQSSQRAVIWRRLLRAATRAPSTLGHEFRELAWTAPILRAHDTTALACAFVRAVFPTLETDEKERVEACITAITKDEGIGLWSEEIAATTRDRLLACLPDPITSAARGRIAELAVESGGPPENKTRPGFGGVRSRRYTTVDFLRNQGVAVDQPASLALRALTEPLAAFAERFRGTAPDAASRNDILPALTSLLDAVVRADTDVDATLRNYAWGVAAHAAERIVWCPDLDPVGGDAVVVTVLLEASNNTEPEYRADVDANFNRAPSWGSPAARIDAAAGLTVLAGHTQSSELDKAVRRLAVDAVAAVRYQVFAYVGGLFASSRGTFDALVDEACSKENNRGVLRVLVGRVLHPLASEDPRRAVELAKRIYDRANEGEGSEEVRETCIALFVDTYLWRGEALSEQALKPAIEAADPKAARCVARLLRKSLTVGTTELPDDSAGPRAKAIALMTELARSVHGRIQLELKTPGDKRTPEFEKRVGEYGQLADDLARQVFYGSGAYDAREGREKPPRERISPEAHRRFIDESVDLIDALTVLSEVGVPSLTHHLLQTFESFIESDPDRSFKRIADLIILGSRGNYQLESLAVTLVVRVFERFLADHRGLLQEPENQRRLIAALDIFVEAGWPEAWELTYRLDEIFR